MKLRLASLLGIFLLGILVWFSTRLAGNDHGTMQSAVEISADAEQSTDKMVSAQPSLPSATSGVAARVLGSLRKGVRDHVDATMNTRAVFDALREPDALRRLKEMAAKGNLFAMSMVGHELLVCSPRGRELSRYRVAQRQRRLERRKNKLFGRGEVEPASASSVARLTLLIASTEEALREQMEHAARCERPEYASPLNGIHWFERAVDSGHDPARLEFVRTVVNLYGKPRSIARYPEDVISLRNQARIYLEQIKAECTPEALRNYAWWSVALYPFDVEQRYVSVFTWLRLQRQRTGEDSAGDWGSSQEAALQRLIAPAQKQRAEAQIEAMLERCGDS